MFGLFSDRTVEIGRGWVGEEDGEGAGNDVGLDWLNLGP